VLEVGVLASCRRDGTPRFVHRATNFSLWYASPTAGLASSSSGELRDGVQGDGGVEVRTLALTSRQRCRRLRDGRSAYSPVADQHPEIMIFIRGALFTWVSGPVPLVTSAVIVGFQTSLLSLLELTSSFSDLL
jgi:hypothetical protein